jgi:hypothetical protein
MLVAACAPSRPASPPDEVVGYTDAGCPIVALGANLDEMSITVHLPDGGFYTRPPVRP